MDVNVDIIWDIMGKSWVDNGVLSVNNGIYIIYIYIYSDIMAKYWGSYLQVI